MKSYSQKLSIRLLHQGLSPEDGVREGIALHDWGKIRGAKVCLSTLGNKVPKWANFLDLSADEKKPLYNVTAYGLIFIPTNDRWFAITFGIGHVKLDPAKYQQDFGLRVVLNAVDPKQIKSADIRTPDENTLSRRSQTSRGSDQTAFGIDIERDIVRGLAGTPKDKNFASRVSGTDALSLDRKLIVTDLPTVCAEAYKLYQMTDYKSSFSWIDQIRHIRDIDTIKRLDSKLVEALDETINGNFDDKLHLAYPIIYDPEHTSQIRYKGFKNRSLYSDLDITGYLDALKESELTRYAPEFLTSHTVHEVDDDGYDCGNRWRIHECLAYETVCDGQAYVLSGDRWYQIDCNLFTEVSTFYKNLLRYQLPEAKDDDNEEKYNERLSSSAKDLLCLDKKMVRPTGASSDIEVCDFISSQKHFIHIKDKTSSSRLSHLFYQGTVAARTMIVDTPTRNLIRNKIQACETETGKTGYLELIPPSDVDFETSKYTIVYAVIGAGKERLLPFFSLVSLRQAIRELHALGYHYAFCWIQKPKVTPTGKVDRKKRKAKA